MKNVIVGTAGHIDHGKTSLVKSLTGIDADRLKEEKLRGITIDIGFANLSIGEYDIGFVDVPGHERFIKNMLVGAHGFDLVMLVIAADEGVMPQTREHLEICQLLRIPAGLTVLTKIDLVNEEWLEFVISEVLSFLSETFLANQPILPVSTHTSSGIPQLKTSLEVLSSSINVHKCDQFLPRLPIDRVFSVKGFGTVVTGTLISGSIKIGDSLEIQPGCKKTRARGLEVYGKSVEVAEAGQRVAINLHGISVEEITRGQVVISVNSLLPVSVIDVELELLKSAPKPLQNYTKIKFHQGTAEILGRVKLSAIKELGPGEKCFAQIYFELPIITLPEDRFIIRALSPQITIGGGRVLDIKPLKYRSSDLNKKIDFLNILADGDLRDRIFGLIERSKSYGITMSELISQTGKTFESLLDVLLQLSKQHSLLFVEPTSGKQLVVSELQLTSRIFLALHLNNLATELIKYINNFYYKNSLQLGVSKEEIRKKFFSYLPLEVFKRTVGLLISEEKLLADGESLRIPNRTIQLTQTELVIKEKLEQVFMDAGFCGLSMLEAFEKLGLKEIQAKPIYFMLIKLGSLIHIGEHTLHIEIIRKLIAEIQAQKAKNIFDLNITFFKNHFGLSRKYAIPLLEYLDKEQVTRRVGNLREIL